MNTPAILAVGLAKVRGAKTKKISQHARVLVFQGEEFLARQEATLRFHEGKILQIAVPVKPGGRPGGDAFGQAADGSAP